MALPVTFIANDVARSADVNSNFNYLSGLLGAASTTTRLDLPGDILLGPRNNAQLGSNHDNGASNAVKFFHIGYNMDYYDSGGGVYKYRRLVNGQHGRSFHFMYKGFELWGSTANPSADPNPTMAQFMGIYDDSLYMPNKYRIWKTSSDPGTNYENYRLTYCMMQSPGLIYNGVAVSVGTVIRKATDFGVPSEAIAVAISAAIETHDTSGSRMRFYQDSASRDSIFGFNVTITGGSTVGRGSGWGVVPLGTGAYNHQFVIDTNFSALTYARVGIVGYYV